jgi:signal transduction histidine kinase
MADASMVRTDRADLALRVGAVAVAVVVVVGCLVAALLEPRADDRLGAEPEWLWQLVVVGGAGMVVAWTRPRNLIGWLLLVAVSLQMVSLLGGTYAQAAYLAGDRGLRVLFAAWLAGWTWFPSLALPVAVLPSIYPEGFPGSRGRRALLVLGAAGVAGTCLALAASPDTPADTVPGLAFPVPQPPGWFAVAFSALTVIALVTSIVGGLAEATYRAFRSGPPRRQQLLWLLVPLVPYVLGYFVTLPLWLPGYALVGVAVAVGVLRYRLLDIHVVVRRTLLYVPLVALVFLVVAGVSTAVARVAPDGPLPLLGAAVGVAVLVGPVTGWLRRLVDRRLLGLRADPVAAANEVADVGLRDSRSDPLATALGAAVSAVGVGYAAVLDDSGARLAEVGSAAPSPVRLPLRARGRDVGVLVMERPPDAAGRRVVEALVPHIASILDSARLAAEVEAQRQRAVAATRAERERIRADLHDGLGPSLSGISLGLEAAGTAMSGEQPVARAILARTRAEAVSAIGEVRRVLDALGPSALVGSHLDLAVADAAHRLGFDGAAGPTFACSASHLDHPIPPDVEEVAYRIVAEALHNVARHAGASRCTVDMAESDSMLELRVTDDGVGISSHGVHGVGMRSMRSRATAVGGSCTVSSPPHGGTVVLARLPLAPVP